MDPGFLEYPRLSPRAVIGPGARFVEFYCRSPTPTTLLRVVSGGEVVREVRTFETTTVSLIALSEWLAENGCTHVAMEATGVYWKPVWHILDDGDFPLTLANAAHVKNVPGRKTDVNDATWLADLLAHGRIRASFARTAASNGRSHEP